MINIPQHVIDLLKLNENEKAEDLPIKLLTPADDVLYLWFTTKNIGFLVKDNDWTHMSMADVSVLDRKGVLPFKNLPLTGINIENVKFYNDGSLAWSEKNQYQVSVPSNAKETLQSWSDKLKNRANIWHVKLRKLDKEYLKISAALDTLIAKI